MKLYMKTNSPLLREILDEQNYMDTGWSWWEEWHGHTEVIEEYFGIRDFYASEDEIVLIDKKETYIEVDKGETYLMISGEIEGTYTHKGATKNIGKVVTNKCFKKELDWTWNLYEWSSDGKTTEMTFKVGRDYSPSYGDDENWIRKIDAVGEAMKVLSRFEKVRGGKDVRLDKKQKEHLEKIKVLFTSSPEQALSLAESLELMGNLKNEMVSEAYATIKKMGINLVTIQGL